MADEKAPSYNDRMVAALQRERASYVARDLTDRIQQVDKQLAALGVKPSNTAAVDDAKPKGRQAPAKDDA